MTLLDRDVALDMICQCLVLKDIDMGCEKCMKATTWAGSTASLHRFSACKLHLTTEASIDRWSAQSLEHVR